MSFNASVGLEAGTRALISCFKDASYDCAMYAMLQKITRLPQSLSCKKKKVYIYKYICVLYIKMLAII